MGRAPPGKAGLNPADKRDKAGEVRRATGRESLVE